MDADAVGKIEIINLIAGAVLSPGDCSESKDDTNNERKSSHQGYGFRLFSRRISGFYEDFSGRVILDLPVSLPHWVQDAKNTNTAVKQLPTLLGEVGASLRGRPFSIRSATGAPTEGRPYNEHTTFHRQ